MKPPSKDRDQSDEEDLVDLTEALALKSRKTSRLRRKLDRKSRKDATKPQLLALPSELLLHVLSFLQPSDIFLFRRTCRGILEFVRHHEATIARSLAMYRYPVLTKCFPRPVLLQDVDSAYHAALLDDRRQRMLGIHRKPFMHIASHDPQLLCSCLTCVMAWNNLCLLVDLQYWTSTYIARREPIPIIPRGQNTNWNIALTMKQAAIVEQALISPLWYMLILQRHLETTVFGIRRYTPKDGTPAFNLDEEDVKSGTDAFCARKGDPNYEFPLTRDVYYGLPTYLPNRGWSKTELRWRYQPGDQHFSDLRWLQQTAEKLQAMDAEDLELKGVKRTGITAGGHGSALSS